jgi:hypothetical protein
MLNCLKLNTEMRKITAIVAALMVSMAVWSEDIPSPTTAKKANLKGNVLACMHGKYDYKENFGEPTTGRCQFVNTTFYNEKGQSVLLRKLIPDGSNVYTYSFYFEYSESDTDTKVTSAGLQVTNNSDYLSKYLAIANQANGQFEASMSSFPNLYGGCNPTDHSEFTYDKGNIMTVWSLFYNKYSNNKIKAKYVAKATDNNTYNCTIYKENGDAAERSTRTYTNGLLVKKIVDNPAQIGFKPVIPTAKNGTYKYDANGHVVSYAEQHKDGSNFKTTKWYYNDKGDLTKITETSSYNNLEREAWIYTDYKYDEHGNWVYRCVGTDPTRLKYIETRQIVYCGSSDEVKNNIATLIGSAGQTIKTAQ